MTSSGGGAGKEAVAVQSVHKTLDLLRLALGGFHPGSKHYSALVEVLGKLSKVFGGGQFGEASPMVEQAQQRQTLPGLPSMLGGGPPGGPSQGNGMPQLPNLSAVM